MIQKEQNGTTLGVSEQVETRGFDDEEVVQVPALTVIFHPNLDRIGERLVLSELVMGREVALSRNQPEFAISDFLSGSPLDDPFLSRTPLFLKPGPQENLILDPARCPSRVALDGRALGGPRLISRSEMGNGTVITLADRVVLLLHLHQSCWDPGLKDYGLVGNGSGLMRVRQSIKRVADLKVPVLIRGESGTGKELVAQAIHQQGPRRSGPFVCINLGAISSTLAASELFGSVKGAYTGANSRPGLFRRAHGGTLFLDEVGEAPEDVQIMLLRVLETGEILPVGSDVPQQVDVRIIAATDANLELMGEDRSFRLPLLHRLAGYELSLPPLRERREDIGPLLRHFLLLSLDEIGEDRQILYQVEKKKTWFPASLAAKMCIYDWPGNIREFRNMVRQLIIASRGCPDLVVDRVLEGKLCRICPPRVEENQAPARSLPPSGLCRRKPSEITEDELIHALLQERWDLEATSKRLNIARSSLYPLIRRTPTIRTAGDLTPEELRANFEQWDGQLERMVDSLKVSGKALKRRLHELGLEPV